MAADAKEIANLPQDRRAMQEKNFETQHGMSYATYNAVSMSTLLNDPYFKQSINGLRIAGTEMMVSETMRNRTIRMALQHLLNVVESDVSQDMKIKLAQDVTEVLSYVQFDINMTYKKYANELEVTMTPETVPRSVTQDYKIGRIIKRLQGQGVGIKLDITPLKRQPKLKTTGSAA
jgi:hypothetical protein